MQDKEANEPKKQPTQIKAATQNRPPTGERERERKSSNCQVQRFRRKIQHRVTREGKQVTRRRTEKRKGKGGAKKAKREHAEEDKGEAGNDHGEPTAKEGLRREERQREGLQTAGKSNVGTRSPRKQKRPEPTT